MGMPHKKLWVAALCALLAAALALPVWAAALKPSATDRTAQDWNGEDLFYGYLLQRAGASDRARLMADAGSKLSAKDKELYDLLKVWVAKIASGEIASSTYVLTFDDFPLVWDAEQLGVSAVTEIRGDTICLTSEAATAIAQKINELWDYDTEAVHQAILADCPYEMYWYDKAYDNGEDKAFGCLYDADYSPTFENTLELAYHPKITLTMRVSPDYSGGDPLTLKSDFHDRIDSAVAKAKSIVSAYADKSDYEKLLAYSTEICGLVKYDDAAADDSTNTPYGDPWQLISVFDGDPNTNVVCEGYAKAFQYLCDLSAFDSPNVQCYLATGLLVGGTGAGEHMWNIVTMENGKNYLVDLTNSDSNGKPDYLLLKGGLPSPANPGQYAFYGWITFVYDESAIRLWGGDILTLDTADYSPPPSAPLRLGGFALSVSEKAVSIAHVRNGANIAVTKDNSETESNVALFLAAYDADGKMESFQQWDLDLSGSVSVLRTQAVPDAACAKLIIVSENLTPLAASAMLK